jgi:lipopolysaccharide biosynthesis protein
VPDHPDLRVFDYSQAWPIVSDLPDVAYPTYETVFPGWDNTPRRRERGVVVQDARPDAYERWLAKAIEQARTRPPAERLVFINAWNEWGEGAYLEPDAAHGRGFLEATRRAVSSQAAHQARPAPSRQDT